MENMKERSEKVFHMEKENLNIKMGTNTAGNLRMDYLMEKETIFLKKVKNIRDNLKKEKEMEKEHAYL